MQTWGAGVWAPWGRAEKVALPFVHRRVGDRRLVGSRSLRCDLEDWAGGGVGEGSRALRWKSFPDAILKHLLLSSKCPRG